MLSSGRSGNDSEVGRNYCARPESQTDHANHRKGQGSNRSPAQARHTILPLNVIIHIVKAIIERFPREIPRERSHRAADFVATCRERP
jgi:hypothetical protein